METRHTACVLSFSTTSICVAEINKTECFEWHVILVQRDSHHLECEKQRKIGESRKCDQQCGHFPQLPKILKIQHGGYNLTTD